MVLREDMYFADGDEVEVAEADRCELKDENGRRCVFERIHVDGGEYVGWHMNVKYQKWH